MLAYTVRFRTFRSIESVSQLTENIAHGLSRRQHSQEKKIRISCFQVDAVDGLGNVCSAVISGVSSFLRSAMKEGGSHV